MFDLEIILLFPLSLSLLQVGMYGFSIAIIFFVVLTIGFVMEISSGTLKLNNSKFISYAN